MKMLRILRLGLFVAAVTLLVGAVIANDDGPPDDNQGASAHRHDSTSRDKRCAMCGKTTIYACTECKNRRMVPKPLCAVPCFRKHLEALYDEEIDIDMVHAFPTCFCFLNAFVRPHLSSVSHF